MKNSGHKKTYEGDYSKSYRDQVTWDREDKARRKEYQTISKKLDQQPYNKSETSVIYDIGTRLANQDRVYADGRRSKKSEPVKNDWSRKDVSTSKESEQKQPISTVKESAYDLNREKKKEEPVKILRNSNPYEIVEKQYKKEEPKLNKSVYDEVEEEDDGNYNFYNYPIEEVGYNQYRNAKTDKIIDEDGARKVLEMAGFQPKGNTNIGTVIFLFIIANITFPMAAPFIAIGYGAIKIMSSKKTTWSKNTGGQIYKYSLDATEVEMSMNKKIGQFCVVVGLIFGFYHLFM